MVPEAVSGLDHDEVEAKWQARHRLAIRERAPVEQAVGCGADSRPLAMIDRLLGQAEVAAVTPADLDDDERRRWTRVDRHEIELVTADMDVPGQDGPTSFRQARCDERLGAVTRQLGRRSHRVAGSVRHRAMLPAGAYLRLTGSVSPDQSSDGSFESSFSDAVLMQ
jgi:hypothetical protein